MDEDDDISDQVLMKFRVDEAIDFVMLLSQQAEKLYPLCRENRGIDDFVHVTGVRTFQL